MNGYAYSNMSALYVNLATEMSLNVMDANGC